MAMTQQETFAWMVEELERLRTENARLLAERGTGDLSLRERIEALVDGFEWMGCFTGDCPHNRTTECYKSMLEVKTQFVAELRALLVAPPGERGTKGQDVATIHVRVGSRPFTNTYGDLDYTNQQLRAALERIAAIADSGVLRGADFALGQIQSEVREALAIVVGEPPAVGAAPFECMTCHGVDKHQVGCTPTMRREGHPAAVGAALTPEEQKLCEHVRRLNEREDRNCYEPELLAMLDRLTQPGTGPR